MISIIFVLLVTYARVCLGNLSFCCAAETDRSKVFDYENFFQEKINAKKADSSYRVFKKVSRMATQFPKAIECSADKPKDITVWCSNDYLGMSWHPKVQQAVM